MHTVEWGVEYGTRRDGDYDVWLNGIYRHPDEDRPLTEAEARAKADSLARENIPARLVSRRVTDWSATS